jgi:hypothetical protein
LVDVGSKLLEDVAHAIVQERTGPALKSVGGSATFLARVITNGNLRGDAAAENFREINPAGARVILRDSQTAYGIAGAMEEPSAI